MAKSVQCRGKRSCRRCGALGLGGVSATQSTTTRVRLCLRFVGTQGRRCHALVSLSRKRCGGGNNLSINLANWRTGTWPRTSPVCVCVCTCVSRVTSHNPQPTAQQRTSDRLSTIDHRPSIIDRRTIEPSNHRTVEPSNRGTIEPSNHRTIEPSNHRTIEPSNRRTVELSNCRTVEPSNVIDDE